MRIDSFMEAKEKCNKGLVGEDGGGGMGMVRVASTKSPDTPASSRAAKWRVHLVFTSGETGGAGRFRLFSCFIDAIKRERGLGARAVWPAG